MSTKTVMSVEDFAQMTTAETEDYELLEGELIPLPSATPAHAELRGALESLLREYFRRNRIAKVYAEVDCRLTEESVRRPDLSILLSANLRALDPNKVPVPFAPDIAVEILSPSETATNVHRKALEYLAAGSHEVWQLDQENGELFVQTNSGITLLRGDAILESPLLPGFSVPIATLLGGF